jgi:hypothetical protein
MSPPALPFRPEFLEEVKDAIAGAPNRALTALTRAGTTESFSPSSHHRSEKPDASTAGDADQANGAADKSASRGKGTVALDVEAAAPVAAAGGAAAASATEGGDASRSGRPHAA